MTTTLQVRIDPKLKKEAQKVAKSLGINLSKAVNMFLVQMTVEKAIPFRICTEHHLSPAKWRQLEKEVKWEMKHGKSYSSVDELFKDILGE